MINLMKNLVIVAVVSTASLFGQDVQVVKEGPIHEAFVTRDTEDFILDVLPVPPPAAINERIPPQTDRQAVWVPGYWCWDENRNDYIWMSGVWRRPPPHHQWIPGTWQAMNQGWVWVSGFWSKQPTDTLSFIETAPPEPMNENIAQPKCGEFFWSPGYWEYSERGRGYTWVSGYWEKLEPTWIHVPAHYVWYNDNYVFVPAYWDWPLEDRGTMFSPVYIPPHVRTTIVYQPAVQFSLSLGFVPTPQRRVVRPTGRRQVVNVRNARQDPRNAPSRVQVVDRQDRQVPGAPVRPAPLSDREDRQVSGAPVRPASR